MRFERFLHAAAAASLAVAAPLLAQTWASTFTFLSSPDAVHHEVNGRFTPPLSQGGLIERASACCDHTFHRQVADHQN